MPAMDWIPPLLAWLGQHPTWAGLFVFVVAFSESLALVGLFMPGAALMFGIGALVGTGAMALWPTLAWAAAGAIAGDGISFWLGRHFHGRLRGFWPFRSHPELIDNASAFFQRHGGKSVALGRFVGPIRPVIPAVAGMMDMPASRFFAVNVISGLLWAPVYVLPGMLFATTLGLAAEITTRLAVGGGLLLALLVLVFWLVHRLFRWLHPRAHAMITAVLGWSARHPVAGQLPAALLDPNHREAKGLTLLGLVLIAAVALFVLTLEALGSPGLMRGLDEYVYHALQDLRSAPLDRLMVIVTELGDGRLLSALVVAIAGWLLLRRHWQAAGHLLAAGLFATIASHTLKWITALERPVGLYQGIEAWSFPSGHATHSMAVYGMFAVLLARELSERSRWLAYTLPALLISAIGFSRLYLGAHWLSDVLGGLSLALAWVALVGIAYRRHPAGHISPGALIGITSLAMVLFGSVNASLHFERDLRRYAPAREVQVWREEAWQSGRWSELPAYRVELRHVRRHPLNLQYAGSLETLAGALANDGWTSPPALTALSWLYWLNTSADLASVPLLPQVHDGEDTALTLTRRVDGAMAAVRLWPSGVVLGPGRTPLWVGNVSYLQSAGLPWLTVPITGGGFTELTSVIENDASELNARPVTTDGHEALLLR